MTTGQRSENRVQEISSITRNLKIMAKEMNVPIIARSQLSRAVEKQGNNSSHRPQLSDLRLSLIHISSNAASITLSIS